MKLKKLQRPSRAWLCAMVTSALLFQASGVSFAEEADNQEQFALDEMVVTANRVPTPASKAAANVTVITKDQIEKGPYSNLGDVLRAVNGVVVTSKGFGGAQQIVRLNGDDRVLVMIDGRKIGRPEGVVDGASIDLSTIISLNNIERIEVVKGGASALYGSDAVGGVINIITRKGTEAKTTLDMSVGSWGERNYSLSTQGSENGLSWYITADKKKQDYTKYNVLNPDLTTGSHKGDSREWENSKFEGQGYTMRLDKKIDDNRSVTFNFEHWNDEGGQPWEVKSPKQGLPLYTATHLTNIWALTYNFNQQQEVPGFARVYANYNNQGFYGTYKSRTQGFEYQTGWQLDNQHKLVTGVNWEKGEVLENVYLDEIQGAQNYKNKSITNTAIYLQDIYNLTDKWTMTPGLRYDHHSKFGGQTTPKLNVNYSADSTTDIYVSYNRVFKAPNLDQLYYDLYYPAYFSSMKGNPNLKPEKGHVVSAGVNKKLSNSTSITANYFTSKITDAIDWEYDSNWNGWARNIDEQKKHGFEFDLHHKLSEHYYTDLGYSYVHVENNEANNGYVVDSKNGQPNGYRVKVGFADSLWDVNVNGQSATGRDTKVFVDSSYWVWNLAANYKMTQDSSVYFNVYNLGDKAYELNSSGTGNNRGNYPMPSRHFQLGVKYSF
ncbi:TonB-dependent receptor [Sporomusa sp.]|uniref:TonB-dependent receptor plug domain-containing protein n=1 Tax=Sporomusa sp. TaxID=2078658 RepID=UPI002CF0517E|nr:TonB-dependent receptor [Sporomusa sp.]HWR44889.1 TonB-dependent receptor [Sporomusa sp.]